jgi:hypothetical protein
MPSPKRSPQYRMADRLAGGKLADELARHAAEGHSLRQISLHLFADYGIEVSAATVQAWTDTPEKVAS